MTIFLYTDMYQYSQVVQTWPYTNWFRCLRAVADFNQIDQWKWASDTVSREATVYCTFFSFYRNSDLSEQFKKLFNLSLCGQLAEFSYPVKLRESKDVLNPIKQQVNPACVVLSLSNINQSNKKKPHHDHELYNGPLEKYTSTGTKATLNVDKM